MNILECKLSSIPGLENVPASAPTAVDQQAGPSQEGSQAPPPPPPPPDASMGSGIPGPEDEGSAEPPPPPAGFLGGFWRAHFLINPVQVLLLKTILAMQNTSKC